MGPDDPRPRPTSDQFHSNVRELIATTSTRPDTLGVALMQREDPPRWDAQMMVQEDNPRRNWLSYVTVSVPPSRVLTDADSYTQRIHSWASNLRPEFGTAGFALLDEPGMATHRRGAAWPWLQRYPGLDFSVFNLQPKPGRYLSINWLTLIGESVIATLGGIDTVLHRLRQEANDRNCDPPELRPYPGGALIRACPVPALGDRAAGDIPAAYRAVNAALRPARFEDYPASPNHHLVDAPRSMDRRQATLDWIRRFDEPGGTE